MTRSIPLKTMVVVSPENSKVALTLFNSDFDVKLSTSLVHAQSTLSNKYELIVAATCFDESRMFDLLRYCKASPDILSIPFIAMRIDGLNMDDMTHQAIQIATKALGAEDYIDLQRLPGGLHEKSMAFRQLLTMLIARKRFDI
jgi:hypothetical protein